MTNLTHLIHKVCSLRGCRLEPPIGIPNVQAEHMLLEDIKLFYKLCGGLMLFEDADYPVQIVSPQNFIQSNSMIMIGLSQEQMDLIKNEPSWSWYIIGLGDSGEYISIDLDPVRLGRCYYSFWDTHAMKGYSPIIATSFSELLERLIENRGEGRYWEQPSYASLGDAYDAMTANA
jgi:antitoxin YokJ